MSGRPVKVEFWVYRWVAPDWVPHTIHTTPKEADDTARARLKEQGGSWAVRRVEFHRRKVFLGTSES